MSCKISKDIYSQLGYCPSTIYSTRVQTHSTHSFTTYADETLQMVLADETVSSIIFVFFF